MVMYVRMLTLCVTVCMYVCIHVCYHVFLDTAKETLIRVSLLSQVSVT